MKKELKIIDVKPSGKRGWYGGAFGYHFIYSKYDGNFILIGYAAEVNDYLKANHTHYFRNSAYFYGGECRNIWNFWKNRTYISKPNKKNRRYVVRNYEKNIEYSFKRMPNRWIDKFDLF